MEQDRNHLIQHISRQGITDAGVLNALARVPREKFIPEHLLSVAYEDRPLPIGWDQTISQPYTVAFMAQLLRVEPGARILEIGCGSGYNAAVLQELTGSRGRVYSVERITELAQYASSRLDLTGYNQIKVILGDGKEGWADHAPFDRIIVTAQGPDIPQTLISQLKPGGILVMPVTRGFAAEMARLVKHTRQEWDITYHGAFSFVPLR